MLTTRAGSTRPGKTSSTTSARVPGLMYSRLFSRTKACSHTSRASRKVSAGWPAAANWPMFSCRLVTTPSPGARKVVRARSRRACSSAASASRICGLSAPLGAERLARLLQRCLRTLHLRFGCVQLRPRLVAFRRCIDADAHQLEDPGRLLTNVVPLCELLHQLRLGLIHPGGGGADGLPGRRELGLGTLHGDAERGRIDAVQQVAGTDDLIVMHRDLDDLARDLRSDAHHEGPHAGVAGVGCQPVGNQCPTEQQNEDD